MGLGRGQGLGKNGEGRLEPVKVAVLPKGKSLDFCVSAMRDTIQTNEAIDKRIAKPHVAKKGSRNNTTKGQGLAKR